MRLNNELDYDTIYNGRGIEIGKMLVNYLDEKIDLIKKEELLPDRPDRNNKVGIKLTFRLADGIEILCVVNLYPSFILKNVGVEKKRYLERDYMTFEKSDQLDFSFSNEVIYEKPSMIKSILDTVRKGDEIIKFDVEKVF